MPAQGNRPGRIEDGRVHGLGASDMKGALAVMIELALARAPFRCLFFGREELPVQDSALTPLLEREPLAAELVVMMEPTACELHAGCLGNVNATWTFHGRSGHSARPWTADNAIERAAAGVLALAAQPPVPHTFDGLEFVEVASVTTIAGGIAANVIPDRVECHVNFRYAPGRSAAEAEARLAELCAGHGELRIDSNAPSGPVATGPRVDALVAAGELVRAPKQAWTPVAEFGLAGLPAVNFGPGDPAQAHRRDESVEIAALVRAYEVLERFGVRVAPALTGLETYPFVRLAEAKRRLLAAGADLIDFGIGEPREQTPAFIREALVAGLRPLSTYPQSDGLPELRAAVAGWTAAALRRGARSRHPGAAHARLQGGDLPSRAGARRRAGRDPRARVPGLRARRAVRRQAGARAAAARGRRLPARPRRGRREHLARRRDPVAQLPEQPDRGDGAAQRSTSARPSSRASTASSSRATRPTRRSTSATNRRPRRWSSRT